MSDKPESAAGVSSPPLHCWRFLALLNVGIAAAFYVASGLPLSALPNTVAAVMFLAFIACAGRGAGTSERKVDYRTGPRDGEEAL